MKYRSVFDIIGPIMIGPSSSHTAGAARIGRVARRIFGRKPDRANITLYGSFAKTYKGHGTDIAIVGGLLDLDTFDEGIVRSLEMAKEQGLQVTIQASEEDVDHPNTAKIELSGDQHRLEIVGTSIGGGSIEIISINGFNLRLSGHHPALLVLHEDKYGMIAQVANVLSKFKLNIGHMEVARKSKGSEALMVIETDQPIGEQVLAEIGEIPSILTVTKVEL
ncbi:L-serine dehydratase, iron-sulfur-dependent, beta subunit [Caldalkalibacillus thermarum TA2.A1]|uniref:L-serine deaminase n=1 Tax=Caldalkalibacillus thermarum (strain TA2.A1) TaxID=986075 RepID=F5L7T5_CALTT|nr:L-serine ammonia-lyase, iron-sulfur-dependent subunit beta [Caldalkalibacillus thermarum]EGL82597.1 L-serine dehydratase, iron-sulfur-dependent, beta subunit [Caldalkalibacillus thermarum TA2.A1]QZT32808.1 L-serine ammonia-lyase, iron-sulfur-dependent subunit beta [Caldalkalibacillus thermarum TA2.A1]